MPWGACSGRQPSGPEAADFEAPSDLAARPDRDDFLELQEVLFRACDNDPDRRYRSAEEMHRDLRRVLSGESLRELKISERRARRSRRIAGVSAAACLVLGLGIWWENRRNAELTRLEAENRSRAVQLHLSSAERAIQDGLWHQAELWLTRALEFTRDPALVERLRWRLGLLKEISPQLVAVGGHGALVNEVAFDPSGRWFVTASDDGTARVWDSQSGRPVSRPLDHGAAVNDAQFSPDGRQIVTATADGTVCVWVWETGELQFSRRDHEGQVWRAEFSPDGRYVLSAGRDGLVRLRDARSGIEVGAPGRHTDPVKWAEFSPDGRWIASAGYDDRAAVWGVPDGRPRFPPIPHPGDVRYVTFSPDGTRMLTACADGVVRTWDAASGARLEPTIQHLMLNYAGYSHDGRRIVTATGNPGESSEARVWDARTGSPVGVPVRHRSRVRYAQFSPDDRWLATASHDGQVHLALVGAFDDGLRLWHRARVWSLAFSPDGGRLVSAGEEPIWRMWGLQAQRSSPTRVLEREGYAANAWQTDDSRWLVGTVSWITDDRTKSPTGFSRIWTLDANGRATSNRELPEGTGVALVDPIHNRILALKSWTHAQVLDLETLSAMGPECHLPGIYRTAAFSHDGHWLVTADDLTGVVRAWDLRTRGSHASEITLDDSPVWHLALSRNGRRIAICAGRPDRQQGYFALAEFPSLRRVGEIRIANSPFRLASFAPGDATVAVARDKGVKAETPVLILDSETGKIAGPVLLHRSGQGRMKWSPDGRRLYCASTQGGVQAWSITDGQLLWEVSGGKDLPAFDLSPDGRRLVACSDGTSLVILDSETGDALSPPMRRGTGIVAASFSKDGQWLLSASLDGEVRRLPLRDTRQSVRELRLEAECQAGMEIGSDERLRPLSPAGLMERWEQLSRSRASGVDDR